MSKETGPKSQIGSREQRDKRGRTVTKEQGCRSKARVTRIGAGKRRHLTWEGQFGLENYNLVMSEQGKKIEVKDWGQEDLQVLTNGKILGKQS